MKSLNSTAISSKQIVARLFSFALAGAAIGLLTPSRAEAGFFEISASGSYRRSVIDTNAYDESRSLTGSLAYYLSEASALELSYTDAQSRRAISEGLPNGHVTTVFQTMIGLDLMYTIGGRDAVFRPYIKAGALWILDKRIVDQYRDGNGTLFPAITVEGQKGAVPSAGIGFRLALTENLSLKVGVDAWSSQPTGIQPVTIDYAGRLGLSVMF